MKSKNFILLFIFGLFIFLLPNFTEAACPLGCCKRTSPYACGWAGPCLTGYERLGLIGNVGKLACDDCDDWGCSNCSSESFACAASTSNGTQCAAVDQCTWPVCNDCVQTGVWDASESKCVSCNGGKKEELIRGDTSEVYAGCAGVISSCSDEGNTGDGQCESACATNPADPNVIACDEKNPGDSCGSGGTCDNNCQCILPPEGCTIGGTSYDDGECNPSNKCEYCDASEDDDWTDVPSGKVCYNNSLVTVSDDSGHYCNYDDNCERGNCSATQWYTSCDGSGSCRAASDHTASYSYTFNVSNGYVLESDCSEVEVSSSYYCDMPIETCEDAADCDGSIFYRGCYQGSCSSSSNYGYTDTSDDSACDHVVCSSTNYCRSSCAWYTGKKCLDGSCSLGYGGGNCNPYTCSGGSCTTICSVSCGAVCEDDGDCPEGSTCQANCTCSGVNNPPNCDAGSDKTVNETQSVQLDCSASDPDGDSLTYSWSCTGGSLNNSSILQPVYTAPSVETNTDYTCTLDVSDGKGGNCSDSMVVHVQDVPVGVPITPPVVVTIADATISEDPDHPGQYRAILTGFLDSLGYAPVTCTDCKCIVWFEWGTSGTAGVSGSYGNSNTPVEMTTEDDYFYYTADDLDSGTTFKFEAFAKNGGSW